MPPLSAASSREIRDRIDTALRGRRATSATFAGPPLPAPPEMRREFCAIWPTAKPILKAVAPLLALVPRSEAGSILGALVAVADHAYQGVCPPRP